MPAIGVIGLGTMGNGFCRHLLYRGVDVSCFTINQEEIDRLHEDIKTEESKPPQAFLQCTTDIKRFVSSLQRPRSIALLITAGKIVDTVLDALLPLLDPEDNVLDCGNEWYVNTIKRIERCLEHKISFCGLGVSGGAYGARHHPCWMFGGDVRVYNAIKGIMQQGSEEFYVGPGASGHYVKMVHNGIEYAIMQVLAEIYTVMKYMIGLQNETISSLMKSWSDDESKQLKSYLLDITVAILVERESDSNYFLLDKIEGISGANGTGKWTVMEALELSIPVPSITIAVEMRNASNQPKLENYIDKTNCSLKHDISEDDLARCILLCMQCIFSQGFSLLAKASDVYKWDLDLSRIARIWSHHSIVSCSLLDEIASNVSPDTNLLSNPVFSTSINRSLKSCKKVIRSCVNGNIAVPCIAASLQYIQTLASFNLGHNMIQAQRDYFGSHGFTKIGDTEKQHHNWSRVL